MECKINFPGKIEKEKHWKEKHTYRKCDLCDFATNDPPTLASHVEAKHSDEGTHTVILEYINIKE